MASLTVWGWDRVGRTAWRFWGLKAVDGHALFSGQLQAFVSGDAVDEKELFEDAVFKL